MKFQNFVNGYVGHLLKLYEFYEKNNKRYASFVKRLMLNMVATLHPVLAKEPKNMDSLLKRLEG